LMVLVALLLVNILVLGHKEISIQIWAVSLIVRLR
jgi:hypothetical protein